MKIDIRWQLLLAAICLALVVSILGYQVQTTGLCQTRVPSAGGILSQGIVGKPQRINPIFSYDNPVDQELVDMVFDGLTRYDESGLIQPALAESWQFSEDGLKLSFKLQDNIVWHDGEPVTAEDVAYTYRLLQDDSLPIDPSIKGLWQSVVISQTDSTHIEFVLPEPYGPFIDATTQGVLPAHLLVNVPVQQLADHRFNTFPVGTGPFLVSPSEDWQRSGTLRLAPNPSYWRQGTEIGALEYKFFADEESLTRAAAEGAIQSISDISPTGLVRVGNIPGMRLFTSPASRMAQLIFNMSDSGHPALRVLETRQALARAIDRQSIVDEAIAGQGLPLEGPFMRGTWAYQPTLVTGYDYDPAVAVTGLETAGWMLGEGSFVREKEGQSFHLVLLSANTREHTIIATQIAEQWKTVGVETELIMVSPSELRVSLEEGSFDVALIDVEPGRDPDLYDFWSQEAIINGQNYGGWNNRRASEALEEGRRLTSVESRSAYYDSFLKLFDADLPALTLFQYVQTFGLSDTVKFVDVGPVTFPRDRYQTFSDWFLLYREVPVSCPDDSTAMILIGPNNIG